MDWCGVVAIDKPGGISSRQVVDKVAKLVRPAKAGHAGTLDPLATGVLVVAVGSATRLISYVQEQRKRYVGRFRLGQRSDTDDIEGEVVAGGDWSGVTESMLSQAADTFLGVVSQVPPQFSAVHVDGQRAYALARRGQAVDIKARPVEVFSICVSKFEPPDFELQVECGSGTYIRSISRDLGEMLGCGAVMTSLRRMAVGAFDADSAIPFDELDAARLLASLQPPICALPHHPRLIATVDEIRDLRQGKMISAGEMTQLEQGAEVAILDEREILIGIARFEADRQRLQPFLVFPAKPS
jgi:tRNA pseudouridine55 synthase